MGTGAEDADTFVRNFVPVAYRAIAKQSSIQRSIVDVRRHLWAVVHYSGAEQNGARGLSSVFTLGNEPLRGPLQSLDQSHLYMHSKTLGLLAHQLEQASSGNPPRIAA